MRYPGSHCVTGCIVHPQVSSLLTLSSLHCHLVCIYTMPKLEGMLMVYEFSCKYFKLATSWRWADSTVGRFAHEHREEQIICPSGKSNPPLSFCNYVSAHRDSSPCLRLVKSEVSTAMKINTAVF